MVKLMTTPANPVATQLVHDILSANSVVETLPATPHVAVLIPCYNEQAAIAAVVADFQRALPNAAIYVYDNNSTDDTRTVAATAGAIVRHEPLQGKGHVVRRMFADIEADAYVLVDGDGTYDAASATRMVELCSATRSTWSTAQESRRPATRTVPATRSATSC